MATNVLGLDVPAGSDPFDPAGDMADLALSQAGRIVVPVANQAARNALHAALVSAGKTPSGTTPLLVRRADTGCVEECVAATPVFYKVTGPRTIVDSGVIDAGQSLAIGGTKDILGATDAQVVLDPGGQVELTIAFHYVSQAANIAAAMRIGLLVDGVLQTGELSIHTGLGAVANVQKVFTTTLKAWVAPGTRTLNARLTHTGGATAVSVSLVSFTVRA